MMDDVLHKNLILHPKASSSVLGRATNAARNSLQADERLCGHCFVPFETSAFRHHQALHRKFHVASMLTDFVTSQIADWDA